MAYITYIRPQEEFVYVAIILDAYSRLVIGWALERTLEASLRAWRHAYGAGQAGRAGRSNSSFRPRRAVRLPRLHGPARPTPVLSALKMIGPQ